MWDRGFLDLGVGRWKFFLCVFARFLGLGMGRDFWSVAVRGWFFVLLLYLLIKFLLF